VVVTNFNTLVGSRTAWIFAAVLVVVLIVALARRFLAARKPKRERGSARRLGSEA
jgi:hypothetical protein